LLVAYSIFAGVFIIPAACWKPTGPPSAIADFISPSQGGHHDPHGPSEPPAFTFGCRFVNMVRSDWRYFGTSADSTAVAVLKLVNANPICGNHQSG
jgi:hypothetical protein